MSSSKVKQLYIVKPMKLIERKEKENFVFPYNFLASIGLLVIPSEKKRTSDNPNVPLQIPKKEQKEESFLLLKNDITLALLDKNGRNYLDVIDGHTYFAYNPLMPYKNYYDKSYTESQKVVAPNQITSLENYLCDEKVKSAQDYEEVMYPVLCNIGDSTVSITQLKELREKLINQNSDKIITYKHSYVLDNDTAIKSNNKVKEKVYKVTN